MDIQSDLNQDDGQVHEKTNWGRVPEKLMHDITMPDGAVRLYAHMIWRYGKNRRNFEARQSMAQMLGVSDATITGWVAALVERDWIIAIPRSTFREGRTVRTTNFYHIFPSQAKCAEYRKMNNLDKPAIEANKSPFRKGRKGIGGRPSHKSKSELELNKKTASNFNSSSQIEGGRKMNLSSPDMINSSLQLLESYLDVDNYLDVVKTLAADDDIHRAAPADPIPAKVAPVDPEPPMLREVPKEPLQSSAKVSPVKLPQYGDLFVLVHRYGFKAAPDKASKGRAGKATIALLEDYPDTTINEFNRFADDWKCKKGQPDFPKGTDTLPSNFGEWRATNGHTSQPNAEAEAERQRRESDELERSIKWDDDGAEDSPGASGRLPASHRSAA